MIDARVYKHVRGCKKTIGECPTCTGIVKRWAEVPLPKLAELTGERVPPRLHTQAGDTNAYGLLSDLEGKNLSNLRKNAHSLQDRLAWARLVQRADAATLEELGVRV
jgi:hypothetical protein